MIVQNYWFRPQRLSWSPIFLYIFISYIVQYPLSKVYILYKVLLGGSNNQFKHDIR